MRLRTPTSVDLKDFEDENGTAAYTAAKDREINLVLTALYLAIELARRLGSSAYPNSVLKDEICMFMDAFSLYLATLT